MRSMTGKQIECLRVLKAVEVAQDLAPTVSEVSRIAGKRLRSWARDGLLALEKRGLAVEGRSRRWRLTSEGRETPLPAPPPSCQDSGKD